MTDFTGFGNRIEFSVFGHFDSISVYRSTSTFTNTTLPSPLVVGLKTPFYLDRAVVDGVRYYYMVAVHRGSETVYSPLNSVVTSQGVVAITTSGGGFLDIGSAGIIWENMSSGSNLTFTDGDVLTFVDANNTGIRAPGNLINFNNGDYEISVYAKVPNVTTRTFLNIFMNTFNTWSGGTMNLGFGTSIIEDLVYKSRIYFNSAGSLTPISYPYTPNVEYFIRLVLKGSTISLYVNENLAGSMSRFTIGTYSHITIGYWGGSPTDQQFVGQMRKFRIKKLS